MGLFFKDTTQTYNILDDTPLDEIEQETITPMPVPPLTNSEEWCDYAYMRMMQATNRDNVYSACFSYYISLFMTDMGVSAEVEAVYFKDSLLDYCIHLLEEIKGSYKEETIQKQEFYKKLYNEFKTRKVQVYEKKAFTYTAKISKQTRTALGENKTKTLIEYINSDKTIATQDTTQRDKKFNYKLTWTEKKTYDLYAGESATQKLLNILYYNNKYSQEAYMYKNKN